ncbi:allergen Arg r 1-like [Ornithodoros turicata]|uniref:allergen Arg r 1-like n=1 Tax=Ornithodoros turicata TaxID=34597 RepID=UPI0031392097
MLSHCRGACRSLSRATMIPVVLLLAFGFVSAISEIDIDCLRGRYNNAWEAIEGPSYGVFFLRRTTRNEPNECPFVRVPTGRNKSSYSKTATLAYGYIKKGKTEETVKQAQARGAYILLNKEAANTSVEYSDPSICYVTRVLDCSGSRPGFHFELWRHSHASHTSACCSQVFRNRTQGKKTRFVKYEDYCPGVVGARKKNE